MEYAYNVNPVVHPTLTFKLPVRRVESIGHVSAELAVTIAGIRNWDAELNIGMAKPDFGWHEQGDNHSSL